MHCTKLNMSWVVVDLCLLFVVALGHQVNEVIACMGDPITVANDQRDTHAMHEVEYVMGRW